MNTNLQNNLDYLINEIKGIKYMVVCSVKDLINELLETSCYVDDTVEVVNAVGTPYQIAKVVNKDGIVTLVLDDE